MAKWFCGMFAVNPCFQLVFTL